MLAEPGIPLHIIADTIQAALDAFWSGASVDIGTPLLLDLMTISERAEMLYENVLKDERLLAMHEHQLRWNAN